jgi:hypothetical protein
MNDAYRMRLYHQRARLSRFASRYQVHGHTILGVTYRRKNSASSVIRDACDVDLLARTQEEDPLGEFLKDADPNSRYHGMDLVIIKNEQIAGPMSSQRFHCYLIDNRVASGDARTPAYHHVTGVDAGRLRVEELNPATPEYELHMDVLRRGFSTPPLKADAAALDQLVVHLTIDNHSSL